MNILIAANFNIVIKRKFKYIFKFTDINVQIMTLHSFQLMLKIIYMYPVCYFSLFIVDTEGESYWLCAMRMSLLLYIVDVFVCLLYAAEINYLSKKKVCWLIFAHHSPIHIMYIYVMPQWHYHRWMQNVNSISVV